VTSIDAPYLKTLLLYYEEEIMGEAYFYGLAEHFDGAAEREKLAVLAKVERRAADVVRPLVDKHGLVPRDDAVLKALGEASVGRHRHFGWRELMTYITTRFPAYLDEFDALEKMAPEDDLAVLKRLTYHEVVTIDFAHKEIAGDPDSLAPLRRYLDHGAA
jgi:hypothetical protein